jgi:hypothetical protein
VSGQKPLNKQKVKKIMSTNIKNTLDEVKSIINELKTQATNATALTGEDLTNLEKRIAHLLSKSQPRHTNLTADLTTDLTDLEHIATTIGEEKLKTDAELKKLSDEKTQLTTDLTAKDALLKQKDQEIGAKITADLITKLETLANKNLELKKVPKKDAQGQDLKDKDGNTIYEEIIDLSELKTALSELKAKNLDLTPTNTKLDEVKDLARKHGGSIPAWVGYTGLVGGLCSFLLLVYSTFLKTSPQKDHE